MIKKFTWAIIGNTVGYVEEASKPHATYEEAMKEAKMVLSEIRNDLREDEDYYIEVSEMPQ